MMILSACSLIALTGCQSTKSLSNPCDVLVRLEPKAATADYMISNDRNFAVGVAQHRGRYQKYQCGGKS